MKKINILISALLCMVLILGACQNGKGELKDIEVSAGYTRLDLEETTYTLGGFGAQIDTDVYMPWNRLTSEEEQMLADRVREMNLQYTRIKMFPEFFEMANDNDDYNNFDYDAPGVDMNSVEMQALYKVLDLCEANNIKVDLSWYGCMTTFVSYDEQYSGSWLGYDFEEVNGWVSAPRLVDRQGKPFAGYEEYAENICAGLKYLINEKKYTCLYGFSVIAEMFINSDGAISWTEYSKCLEVINNKLIKEGIRDKITFIGTSNNNRVPKYFDEEQSTVSDFYDIFGFGNYNWDNNSDMDGARSYFKSIREICDKYGKEIIISELGTGGHFTDATTRTDIDDYDAGLYLTRLMVACMENGVTTLNHYILGDTFFTNAYVHRLGLWMYRTEDWKAHPSYYFWGLMCKYSEVGSKIFTLKGVEGDEIMGIAFKLPDGSWSYMIANNSKERKKIAIVNGRADRPDRLSLYKITESSIPEDRACVLPSASDTVDTAKGVAYLSLPAKSFTVVSDKNA